MNIERHPDRATWLAARESGTWPVSATEVAPILGRGAYGVTAWSVFARRKIGVRPPDDDRKMRGRLWESPVLAAYALRQGILVEPTIHTIVRNGWALCSPDGFAGEGLVEVKTSDSTRGWAPDGTVIHSWPADRDPIPAHYALQGFWQMHACQRPWVDFCLATPDFTELVAIRVVRLMADLRLQSAIVAQVGRWRDRYLIGSEYPPPDRGTLAALPLLYPKDGDKRDATPAEAELVERYAEADARLDAAKAERDLLAAELGLAVAGAAGLRTPTKTLTWVRGQRTNLDSQRLRADHPEIDFESYQSKGEPYGFPRLYRRS